MTGRTLQAYFKDPWNVMDFALVWASVSSYLIQNPDVAATKVVRMLRLLRPLRLIKEVHWPTVLDLPPSLSLTHPPPLFLSLSLSLDGQLCLNSLSHPTWCCLISLISSLPLIILVTLLACGPARYSHSYAHAMHIPRHL